ASYRLDRGLKLSGFVGRLQLLLLQQLSVPLLLRLELLPERRNHRLELLGLRRGLRGYRLDAVVGLPLSKLERLAHGYHSCLEFADLPIALVLSSPILFGRGE